MNVLFLFLDSSALNTTLFSVRQQAGKQLSYSSMKEEWMAADMLLSELSLQR